MTSVSLRFPLLTVGVAFVVGALLAVPGLAPALELTRRAFLEAQLWRVWTGHLVHFGNSHGTWDLAVWLLLGSAIESGWTGRPYVGRRSLARLLAAGGAAISVMVLILQPEVERYRGLSGLDTLLFAWIAGTQLQRGREGSQPIRTWLSAAALLGLVVKIGYECAQGSMLFVDASGGAFAPVPLAHLVGACCGLLGVALRNTGPCTQTRRPPPSTSTDPVR